MIRRLLAALRHPLALVHPGEWDDDPQGASGDLIARLKRWQREYDAELDEILGDGEQR